MGLMVVLAIASFGCSPAHRADDHRPNLLLVTLDTTRTDHLGCYGRADAVTPTLDALAARGQVFDEAYSPAPMTLTAHSTLMTGLLPPQHGARVNGEHRLAPDVPTLAELLGAEGYRTGAFVATFVLDHRFGLDRGFDHYDDDLDGAYPQEVPSDLARYRPGQVVVDAALEWLDSGEAEGPFFAWVHLYDAHFPWFSHEEEAGDPAPGSGTYEGEIAYLDQQVGRLLDFLEVRGLTENTVISVMADHGEGLGDHGETEHAYLLNEEVLHVPWIMAGPGVVAGRRVGALVALEDFLPTTLDLLDLPAPEDIPGRSLAPALRGEAIGAGVSYAETDLPWTAFRWAPQRSLTTEQWKYIRTPLPELYNRATDRAELVNLVEVEPGVRADLEAQLAELEACLGERESEGAELSDEQRQQLAALGYTVGGNDRASAGPGGLADVKDRLAAKALAARLREGMAKESLEPAAILEMARELVQMSPETPEFHGHLGRALVQAGEWESGIAELELVVGLEPEDAGALYDLGDALQQRGDQVRAREYLEKALALAPGFPAAQVGMGNVLRAEGRPDLAAGRYTKALELRPEYPEAHFNLALTFLDRNDPSRAEDHYQRALELRPDWGLAHASLANLYASWGKAEQAARQYAKALEFVSGVPELHCDYGIALEAQGCANEALEQYREAERLAPEWSRPHLLLARAAFVSGDDAGALAEYEEALRLEPGQVEPTARLARFLATCPDECLRDGDRAVALAERANDLAESSNPRVLDTLAAAYAAAGDFTKAVSTAHEAQQLAKRHGNAELAAAIEGRLGQYAVEEVFVEERPHTSEGASAPGPNHQEMSP